MIDLNKDTLTIKEFLTTSIESFRLINKAPNSIGIYCCPWLGWISINFNVNKKLTETKNNCPDFEYVEYDLLEMPEWGNEYQTDNPEFKINNKIKIPNHDLGDEGFNKLIFDYLKPIVIEFKASHQSDFLLQMLDSNLAEEI